MRNLIPAKYMPYMLTNEKQDTGSNKEEYFIHHFESHSMSDLTP